MRCSLCPDKDEKTLFPMMCYGTQMILCPICTFKINTDFDFLMSIMFCGEKPPMHTVEPVAWRIYADILLAKSDDHVLYNMIVKIADKLENAPKLGLWEKGRLWQDGSPIGRLARWIHPNQEISVGIIKRYTPADIPDLDETQPMVAWKYFAMISGL